MCATNVPFLFTQAANSSNEEFAEDGVNDLNVCFIYVCIVFNINVCMYNCKIYNACI